MRKRDGKAIPRSPLRQFILDEIDPETREQWLKRLLPPAMYRKVMERRARRRGE